MGYSGGRLRPWFDTKPNKVLLEEIADRGGARMTELTREKTPVDTAHLKESWKQKPVVFVVDAAGRLVFESGVETGVDYAPYVEHGTGLWGPKHAPYEIRPKRPGGWLHWIDPKTGQDVFAKKVMHPGSPGAHMVAIAVAATEAELDEIARGPLAEWARTVEKQNHTGIGRP